MFKVSSVGFHAGFLGGGVLGRRTRD